MPPSLKDVMSYCGPKWISDYNFATALRFRLLSNTTTATAADHVSPTTSLLLWGGVEADGVPFLEPAFVVDAVPRLPSSGGEYRLVGRAANGSELFSSDFDLHEVADGDGGSSFAFVVPVRPEWEGSLSSVTLSGPGGSFTLDGESNYPMAILRNAQTGQIRGILRDPSPAPRVAADAVGQGAGTRLETLFSRGLPDAAAWRR